MDAPGKLESIQEARDASLVLSKLQGVQTGGILQILKSDWFREQAVFYDLPANPEGILGSFKQTNILSLCPYSLIINQISKDIYIHLNSRELEGRHVNSRSTTQCNATSRFRYTVSFGINVQDTIKYLPFGMSGTETESVTDATLLFTKTRKKLCKHITEKCSIWCYG